MSAQGKAHPPKRRPWKEAHQQALTCSVFVALVAIFIIGVGWKDGYWSKSQQAAAIKGKGP